MVDVGYTIVLLGIILAMYYGSYRMIKNFVNATKKGLSCLLSCLVFEVVYLNKEPSLNPAFLTFSIVNAIKSET